jgi:hypothetical protein
LWQRMSSFVDIRNPQTPLHARVEAAIKQMKVDVSYAQLIRALTGRAIQDEMDRIQAAQMAGVTQLYDPEFLFRRNTFTSFVTTWLLRFADPRKTHPKPVVESVYGLLPYFCFFPHPTVTDSLSQRRYLWTLGFFQSTFSRTS